MPNKTARQHTAVEYPWVAVIALLDTDTTDGRHLDSNARWGLSTTAPLLLIPSTDEQASPVGDVQYMTIVDTNPGRELRAYGTVWDHSTIIRMGNGHLYPQIDVIPAETIHEDNRTTVRGGQVYAIHAGEHPAWPTVRFQLGHPADDIDPVAAATNLDPNARA